MVLVVGSQAGLGIEPHSDKATGHIERDSGNRLVIFEISPHAPIEWIGKSTPTPLVVDRLHRLAHEECFIANSIRNQVIIARFVNPLVPTGRGITSEETFTSTFAFLLPPEARAT